MKGKKFTAAEKHFQEKEVNLRKEIHYWKELAIARSKEIDQLKKNLAETDYQVKQQQDWIERLLQYTELKKEDIESACQKDKKLSAFADMILGLSAFWKF